MKLKKILVFLVCIFAITGCEGKESSLSKVKKIDMGTMAGATLIENVTIDDKFDISDKETCVYKVSSEKLSEDITKKVIEVVGLSDYDTDDSENDCITYKGKDGGVILNYSDEGEIMYTCNDTQNACDTEWKEEKTYRQKAEEVAKSLGINDINIIRSCFAEYETVMVNDKEETTPSGYDVVLEDKKDNSDNIDGKVTLSISFNKNADIIRLMFLKKKLSKIDGKYPLRSKEDIVENIKSGKDVIISGLEDDTKEVKLISSKISLMLDENIGGSDYTIPYFIIECSSEGNKGSVMVPAIQDKYLEN